MLGQNYTWWTTGRGNTSYYYVLLYVYVLKFLGVCRTEKCFAINFTY